MSHFTLSIVLLPLLQMVQTPVTISQEPEYNIETGIELILKYVVVTFNNSNECIHNAFNRQT